jgi:death-on-curing protein
MALTIEPKINFLSLEDVMEIHQDQMARTGQNPALRSKGLLRACLSVPSNKIGGRFAHQDVFEMAAAYLFHMLDQKPFMHGNKRVAALCCIYFLYLHEIELNCPEEQYVQMVAQVSLGKIAKMQIADFLRKNSTSLK